MSHASSVMMRFLKKFRCLDNLFNQVFCINDNVYLRLIWPQKASLLTLFPLRSFWCFLSLNAWSPSFFLAILKKLDGEMLKGFRRDEHPAWSAFLALSISSWALTSSTMSSLQTSSTPSLEDGLRFLRSCTVPFVLNFLISLFRDLLEEGGGALATPHVGAGHLMMRMRQEKEKELDDYLLAYSAPICARSAPCIFFSTKNMRWASLHSLTILTNDPQRSVTTETAEWTVNFYEEKLFVKNSVIFCVLGGTSVLSHFFLLGGTSSILRTFLGGTSQKKHPVYFNMNILGTDVLLCSLYFIWLHAEALNKLGKCRCKAEAETKHIQVILASAQVKQKVKCSTCEAQCSISKSCCYSTR